MVTGHSLIGSNQTAKPAQHCAGKTCFIHPTPKRDTATESYTQRHLHTHLRHNTIGHRDRVTTDLKEYFESELTYRRAKDSYM
jgi:hypothetical protein